MSSWGATSSHGVRANSLLLHARALSLSIELSLRLPQTLFGFSSFLHNSVRLWVAPPLLWCDNLGTQALTTNPVHHARTKHIELDVHYIRDLVATCKFEVRYVSSLHQPTDIFTKSLPVGRLPFLFSKLNVEPSSTQLEGAC